MEQRHVEVFYDARGGLDMERGVLPIGWKMRSPTHLA